MIHFKIVSVDDDKCLKSCGVRDSSWYVQYQLNIPTIPRRGGSKLFVFNDLKLARDWAIFHRPSPQNIPELGDWAIYECEVENPTLATCRSRSVHPDYMWDFWDNRDIIGNVTTPPEGTCFADSVTLVKFVEIVPIEL
jgi:hypothetical protein